MSPRTIAVMASDALSSVSSPDSGRLQPLHPHKAVPAAATAAVAVDRRINSRRVEVSRLLILLPRLKEESPPANYVLSRPLEDALIFLYNCAEGRIYWLLKG